MTERINKRTHSDYTQMAAYLPKQLVKNFKQLAVEIDLGNSEAVERAIDDWCETITAWMNLKNKNPKTHQLKIHPKPFADIVSRLKKAEFRLNDRNFKAGDILQLQEYDAESQTYTGKSVSVIVFHLQTGYGIPENYCMMSFELDE